MRFSIFLSFFCLLFQAAYSQTVSIRSDEWFPMNGQPGDEPAGFMVDLANKTFEKVDYKLMPWQRAIEEVRAGKYDCVIGGYKEDTPDFVFPKENWGVNQFGVYVQAHDSWQYQGLPSLSTRKVGIVKGYSYEQDLDDFIAQNGGLFKVATGVDGIPKNFKKLAMGRIDTVIESIPVAEAQIVEMGLQDKLKRVGTTNKPSPMYIACSPNKASSLAVVQQVDKVTRQLRDSGELEQIMNRYGLTDWQ